MTIYSSFPLSMAAKAALRCAARWFKVTLIACASIPVVCSAQSAPEASSQAVTGPLTAVIQPYIDKHELAGAVILAANRDCVVDREAIGYADIAHQKAMKTDDLFWIASMSKAMTASAVMMLVDEGKVKLDDPVEKYLPEFQGQKVAVTAGTSSPTGNAANAAPGLEAARHPITVREILSHTSGLPFSSKREPGALDLLPLKSAVESYAAEPLAFQPGQKYSYSNEGINTAGRIVEVVSGVPFATFLQKRLFDPLGMKDTTFWPSPQQLTRFAKSYESSGGTLKEVPISQLTYPLDDRRHRFPIPAGGLFSTADDVARFCQMMANDGTFHGKRFLSLESVRLITTKETGNAVTMSYGFGWNVGDGYFEHSGAYKTDMKVDRKRGWIIILMVQRANNWKQKDRQPLMDSLEQAAISHSGDENQGH